MNRRKALVLGASFPFASGVLASATAEAADEPTSTQKVDREAQLNYYAAQVALFSALAYGTALERLAGLAKSEDMDLARSFVHTINREIQAVNDGTVKMGQATHQLEKTDAMKNLRAELKEAMKAVGTAQEAVDGIGVLSPSCKNISAHLGNAASAMLNLGIGAGIVPFDPPGVEAYLALKQRG